MSFIRASCILYVVSLLVDIVVLLFYVQEAGESLGHGTPAQPRVGDGGVPLHAAPRRVELDEVAAAADLLQRLAELLELHLGELLQEGVGRGALVALRRGRARGRRRLCRRPQRFRGRVFATRDARCGNPEVVNLRRGPALFLVLLCVVLLPPMRCERAFRTCALNAALCVARCGPAKPPTEASYGFSGGRCWAGGARTWSAEASPGAPWPNDKDNRSRCFPKGNRKHCNGPDWLVCFPRNHLGSFALLGTLRGHRRAGDPRHAEEVEGVLQHGCLDLPVQGRVRLNLDIRNTFLRSRGCSSQRCAMTMNYPQYLCRLSWLPNPGPRWTP